MSGFETNEVSKNANGGTEITVRSLQERLDKDLLSNFQIIPSRVRELDPTKIRIYHQHDLAEDPEVNHLANQSSRNRFHSIVFNSNWQMNDFVTKLKIPMNDQLSVIENPIEIFPDQNKKLDGKINLVYFSTPQRGLNILVPVFKALYEKYPNIHLHVYSSFLIYGWKEMDEKFEPLYDEIRNHEGMTYHGYVDQSTIRNALNDMHILAYPCTWKETSCRVLMESMSAGIMCVHPNLAALSDTSGGLNVMYQYNESDSQHAAIFARALETAINGITEPFVSKFLPFIKNYADIRFNIDKITVQWTFLLKKLLQKYPTIESRAIQNTASMFSYRS